MIRNKSMIILQVTLLLILGSDVTAKPASLYVSTDYGAVGDGQTLNTKAIQSAIDGSGDQWMERFPRNSRELLVGRPRLIAIQNCTDVIFSGLSLKNQACWGLFILYSRDVNVKNLNICAEHNIISSDGIDIDSGKRIRIKGCNIDVNDDCIAIKSGKDEDGRRVNRPAEEI